MKKQTSKQLSSVAWENLTFRQREVRLRALEALNLMRKKGRPLTSSTKEIGISPDTFRRHVGNSVTKKKGRWQAKRHDRISRLMTIFSNGRRYNIETRNSKTASIIGRYNSAVGQYTQTGDPSNLQKMKGMVVRGESGKEFVLETRPRKVIAILERLQEPDVPSVYAIAS